MRKRILGSVAAGLVLAVSHGNAAAETLWSLYETACTAHGIDQEQCLCILGQVSDNHDDDAVRYLALDMNLRYDDAASLLEKIGEDEAFAVGMTFDEALNLNCSLNRLAQLAGTYQNAGSGEASSAATALEEASDATLTEIVAEPLQVLRGPHPHLDFSAIEGDVDLIISVVMQSDLVSASAGKDLRPYLAWYEIADSAGGIDVSGNGEVDIRADAPGYASAVQSRALSPKMFFPGQTGNEQVVGQIRLSGGSMYAPFVRYEPASAAAGSLSLEVLSNMTSVEALTQQMSQPQNLHFVFPTDALSLVNAFTKLDEKTIGFTASGVNRESGVDAQDVLVVINSLGSSVSE